MGALRAELKKAKAIDARVSPLKLSVFHLEGGGCPGIPPPKNIITNTNTYD